MLGSSRHKEKGIPLPECLKDSNLYLSHYHFTFSIVRKYRRFKCGFSANPVQLLCGCLSKREYLKIKFLFEALMAFYERE